MNFTFDWKRYKSLRMEEAVGTGNGHVLFSLLSRGSIFNNSLSGLIKRPKESPRRGRLC